MPKLPESSIEKIIKDQRSSLEEWLHRLETGPRLDPGCFIAVTAEDAKDIRENVYEFAYWVDQASESQKSNIGRLKARNRSLEDQLDAAIVETAALKQWKEETQKVLKQSDDLVSALRQMTTSGGEAKDSLDKTDKKFEIKSRVKEEKKARHDKTAFEKRFSFDVDRPVRMITLPGNPMQVVDSAPKVLWATRPSAMPIYIPSTTVPSRGTGQI